MLDQLRHGGLLLVTDRVADARISALAKSLGAEPVHIDAFGAGYLAHDPSMIFDVDLRRIDLVRKLKGVLLRRGGGCRLFIVDPDSRVTTVHASVLGADMTLPRPAKASEINAAIRKHFGVSTARIDDEAVARSIEAGVEALDQSFRSMTENAPLDTTSVLNASGQIAEAVSELGVDDWLATVKGYHVGTFQHCMLVTGVAAAFASRAGMARRDVVRLTVAGLLHDIGKAVVPIELLDKPTALTPEEMAIVRMHPVTGYNYLAASSTISPDALRSVRHHHEFLDGTGYPDGLSGSEIDDLTRIITICDIYSALIERRSYKEPKSPVQAMVILNAMAAAGKLETSLVRELGRIMTPKAA
ncbi:HD-GYP domain-containing protein [Devosia lacusdianchii]|uniref:HD-GYP domain-containing protein n=1 Tax=Devosia lacusdianchii TaxID=2917991 RepID=UPI001F06CDB2|nr:HD domain-containing phosphohydrolase [Devosia sp. JXJ CY 41]